MPDFSFSRPRLLQSGDPTGGFDCGVEELNRYLFKYALQAQSGDGARSYVTFSDRSIVGYYTLAYGSVEYGAAPDRMSKGLAKHPVPVIVLARLAVDRSFARHGLGTELLRDALLRVLSAADIAGLRAVVVDAKDDRAKRFYEKFGFERFPETPYRLFMILKDIRATMEA